MTARSHQYPQAPALRGHGPITVTPEAAARQLFSMTRMAQRQYGSSDTQDELRRAYITGVAAYRTALTCAFWDRADRWAILAPATASSYGDRQRQAYDWGWEDAERGRFESTALGPRPVVYRP